MTSVILGSQVVEQHVFNVLRMRTPIQAALGGDPPRIKAMAFIPPGLSFPCAIHYPEAGIYGGVINSLDGPSEEALRWVVRFIDKGESTERIRAPAKDAFIALTIDDSSAVVTQDGQQYQLTLNANAEFPIQTIVEVTNGVAQIYRQVGFFLDALVMPV